MLPNKTFIYFLLDTPTGKAYYRDNTGTVKTLVITAGIDVSLKNAPANWLDTALSFIPNTTYHAINRSYSTPQEFVKDAVQMIKELVLLGVGTETLLTLAVFKYNSQPQAGEPQYELYYKGNLDLPKLSETVLESLTVNLMEGGVLQLLKSYEGTTLQIPCDGSIPENQKINFDGLLVPDVFYYQLVPINDIGEVKYIWNLATPLAATFINNEGDNYGIIHNDPSFENINYSGSTDPNQVINYSKSSQNFIFLSTRQITVTVKGSVTVRFNNTSYFQAFLSTSTGQLIPITELYYGGNHKIVTFNYNQQVNLAANESLFLFVQIRNPLGGVGTVNVIDILNGGFSLSFVSQAKSTRAWAITAYDLFKLMIKEICRLASTTNQSFNYEATSNLLKQYSNLFITSGDALRASGDSSYQRFFSITQQNQLLQTSFGPVIKITLKDFFQSLEVPLVCALGTGHNGTGETIFIEPLETARYNSDSVTLEVGEVASLKWKFAEDLMFSDFEIGYPAQTYDQKAGKYEYNTTLEMKAPINSFQKKFSKISKIRWDSYGIERLRSNIGDATSTTRNDSDNSVFGLNADTSKWVYDYFSANFTSSIPNPSDAQNTNINFQQNVSCQQIALPITDGEYFQPNNDQAIILFSIPGFSATKSCNLTVNGLINSVNKPPLAPSDTFTLKLWHNGVVIYSNITTVAGVNTPISINYNFTELFAYKDSLYITLETSTTGEVNINTASLSIGTYVTLTGANIPVLSGTSQKLLSFSSIVPLSKPYDSSSVVQYGFQYLVFNSRVPNTNFELQASFYTWISGQAANFIVDVYVNGVLTGSSTVTGSVGGVSLVNTLTPFSRDYKLNDIVFFSASVMGSSLNVSMTSADATFYSNYIKAYSLKRVQYDSLQGVPNIARDSFGRIKTDVAGAPYNIEDITPKTAYRKWRNYIMSCFMDRVTGQMSFQNLSKNSYLSRSYKGEVITENSNEDILGFKRLFYPIEIEVKTNVPKGFAELLSSSVNAHIHGTFMGTDIYFFPKPGGGLTQKPALNESQTWTGILSPKTKLIDFAKITAFKIPNMADNSISCAFASPVQFVPYNQSIANKYHTKNRDQFLFNEQTANWINQDNYGQPIQIGDPIPMQFITRGLDPVYYTVYNCDGTIYIPATNLDTIASPAVQNPYTLWQKSIDTTTWPVGNYYIGITAGVGIIAATLISEPLSVRSSDDMRDTVLIEAKNSFNSQGLVFDGSTPFIASMRVKGGYDNRFKQKYIGKTYVDQPQNITILNGIPYEIGTLFIGRDGGVPDYVPKKIIRYLLMDSTTIDGEGFTVNEGAEFEEVFTKGAPKKIQKIEIRPTKNSGSLSVVASGVDTDSSLIVSVNPQSFGPNITNASGTTETDLIDITVS